MINCPECDHPLKFHTPHCTEVNDNGCSCFCTVTCKSLVEEKACPCRSWAWKNEYLALDVWHHPNCDGYGGHKNGVYKESQLSGEAFVSAEPKLSLLVIDLGNSCVVKVEKGDAHVLELRSLFEEGVQVGGQIPRTRVFHKPFTELREAIEQQAILLRCPFCDGEGFWQEEDADRHYYAIHCSGCEARTVGVTTQELAIKKWNARPGKPIWNGGEWRKLNKTYDEQVDDVPLTVWRYTKENK